MLQFNVLNQKLKRDVSHFLSLHNESHGNIPISSIHHRMMMMMSTEIAHTFHYTALFIRFHMWMCMIRHCTSYASILFRRLSSIYELIIYCVLDYGALMLIYNAKCSISRNNFVFYSFFAFNLPHRFFRNGCPGIEIISFLHESQQSIGKIDNEWFKSKVRFTLAYDVFLKKKILILNSQPSNQRKFRVKNCWVYIYSLKNKTSGLILSRKFY